MSRDSRLTTLLWDVDTQIDFIHASGALAVPGAEEIIPNLRALTQWAHGGGARIVATADDHDVGHAEIVAPGEADWKTTFPPHCMRGTDGQRKIDATALRDPLIIQPVPHDVEALRAQLHAHDGDLLLHKPGTDVFRWNPAAADVLAYLAPARIVVCGVATDFCVQAAVSGLARHAPEAELVIARDAIAAINPAAGRVLLTEWAARGHRIVDTAEIVA